MVITYKQIQVRDASYMKLIQLISEKTKLNFEYYRRNFIERRIKSRMIRVGCRTLNEYYKYILSSEGELNLFLDCFNINYTYYFRNWTVFNQFQSLILESLNQKKFFIQCSLKPDPLRQIKSKKKIDTSITNHPYYLEKTSLYKKLNNKKDNIYIWSIPCASGEEPYSIAMIIDNIQKQIKKFPSINIVASDIDREAIQYAKLGIYNEDSTRDVSKYFMNRYFKVIPGNFGNHYQLSNDIKQAVDFITEDVTKGHKRRWKYDVVFCRYLLIYFNREKRKNFIKILDRHMNEGSLLILGKTETLFSKFNNFKLVDPRNHIYLKID